MFWILSWWNHFNFIRTLVSFDFLKNYRKTSRQANAILLTKWDFIFLPFFFYIAVDYFFNFICLGCNSCSRTKFFIGPANCDTFLCVVSPTLASFKFYCRLKLLFPCGFVPGAGHFGILGMHGLNQPWVLFQLSSVLFSFSPDKILFHPGRNSRS